ncbi:hypothetical protein BN10_1700012 [Phycicoccus elongatus Lp2]|uniref:Uncharacterized protein n=1 Tax=Phycicoccus elongatus Lp2 TaxID=1193181 RepID=N0E119_9MICO|nr:hypothetical protein BN10_1700012 [Phycicoccus elongatus Lp2]
MGLDRLLPFEWALGREAPYPDAAVNNGHRTSPDRPHPARPKDEQAALRRNATRERLRQAGSSHVSNILRKIGDATASNLRAWHNDPWVQTKSDEPPPSGDALARRRNDARRLRLLPRN